MRVRLHLSWVFPRPSYEQTRVHLHAIGEEAAALLETAILLLFHDLAVEVLERDERLVDEALGRLP